MRSKPLLISVFLYFFDDLINSHPTHSTETNLNYFMSKIQTHLTGYPNTQDCIRHENNYIQLG